MNVRPKLFLQTTDSCPSQHRNHIQPLVSQSPISIPTNLANFKTKQNFLLIKEPLKYLFRQLHHQKSMLPPNTTTSQTQSPTSTNYLEYLITEIHNLSFSSLILLFCIQLLTIWCYFMPSSWHDWLVGNDFSGNLGRADVEEGGVVIGG